MNYPIFDIKKDAESFSPEVELYIDEMYKSELQKVYMPKKVDKDELLVQVEKFVKEYIVENSESYEIRIATSPKNAQDIACELRGDRKYTQPLNYPWFSDRFWTSFYSFGLCLRTENGEKIYDKDKIKELEEYKQLLDSGIYNMLAVEANGKNYIIVAPIFSQVSVDADGRLHSTTGPCVRWDDGYEEYAILGIFFDKKMFYKIVNKELSLKDIMSIKNIDEKACALSVYGTNWIVKNSNAKLIDTCKIEGSGKNFNSSGKSETYELFLVQDIFPEDEYFLHYFCPSTGREYFENIEPDVAKKGALESIAWRFNVTPQEFSNIEIHA